MHQKVSYELVLEATDIIRKNALNTGNVDWESVNRTIRQSKGEILQVSDAYSYITDILAKLGDNHSFLLTQTMSEERFRSDPVLPTSKMISDRSHSFGYLNIPGFVETESLSEQRFADLIRESVKILCEDAPSAWIIDLRENFGGNMWPMLLGLEHLLSGPVVGYFYGNNNSRVEWRVEDATASIGSQSVISTTPVHIPGKPWEQPLAILTSDKTCSSGEAVVVALKGRKDTAQIGQSTGGYSTANEGFELSCGAALWLTTSVFADRNCKRFGGRIEPDLFCASDSAENDTVVTAVDWLSEQCR